MPEMLIEDVVEGPEGRSFSAVMTLEFTEEDRGFVIAAQVAETTAGAATPDLLRQEIRFEARNPLDVVGYLMSAAAAYGTCVGWTMGRFTVRKAIRAYRQVSRDRPDTARGHKVRLTGEIIVSQRGEFKTQLKDALWNCATLGLFGDMDDDAPAD